MKVLIVNFSIIIAVIICATSNSTKPTSSPNGNKQAELFCKVTYDATYKFSLPNGERPSYLFSRANSEADYKWKKLAVKATPPDTTLLLSPDSNYIIIPYRGKGLAISPSIGQKIEKNIEFSGNDTIDIKLLLDCDRSLLELEFINKINRALNAVYAGFNINVEQFQLDTKTLFSENNDVDMNSELDSEIDHYLIFTNSDQAKSGTCNYYHRDSTNYFYVLNSQNQSDHWLIIHELLHRLINDHSGTTADVSDAEQNVYFDIFAEPEVTYRFAKHSGKNIFKQHQFNSIFIDNSFQVFVEDTSLTPSLVIGNGDYVLHCRGGDCEAICKMTDCNPVVAFSGNISPNTYMPTDLHSQLEAKLDLLSQAERKYLISQATQSFASLYIDMLNKELTALGHARITQKDLSSTNFQTLLSSAVDKVSYRVAYNGNFANKDNSFAINFDSGKKLQVYNNRVLITDYQSFMKQKTVKIHGKAFKPSLINDAHATILKLNKVQ